LMVSTFNPSGNYYCSQIGSSPQRGIRIKKV